MSSPTSTACSSCWQGRSDEGMAQGLQALTSFEAVALMSPAAPAPPGGTYASRPPQQRRVPRRGPVDPEPVLHHPPPGLAERAARREVEREQLTATRCPPVARPRARPRVRRSAPQA